MTALRALATGLGFALAALAVGAVDSAVPRPPPGIKTHADGRLPIHELYSSYLKLEESGWHVDIIAFSKPAGTSDEIPIIALRSPRTGPAVWLISGIHGEEPAGPNAIAATIGELAELGRRRPVVLIPLCNPHGYSRNWRYLNAPDYEETFEAQSVGDSSHMLSTRDEPHRPRAAAASSPEAAALTQYILRMADEYPPRYSIDLHEDDLISKGYVYSQGGLGDRDPLAIEAVRLLRENDIPVASDGTTRFGEKIVNGIIGPVTDSSIDELMSARAIVVDGNTAKGPAAGTVLVFETPAGHLTLRQRTAAHVALIRRITATIHRRWPASQ